MSQNIGGPSLVQLTHLITFERNQNHKKYRVSFTF
jgi:hypothetical protein